MTFISDQCRIEIIQSVLTARAERASFLETMKVRQAAGWKVARQAAKRLKKDFGVSKVILFGSMLNPERMTDHSDIDLAVKGLPKEDFFKAGAVIEKDHDFEIDLIEIEFAPAFLQNAIKNGIEL